MPVREVAADDLRRGVADVEGTKGDALRAIIEPIELVLHLQHR